MSVKGGLNRISLTWWSRFFTAVLLSWSFGIRLERAWTSLFRFIFFSLEKESRNSSHSSIMSRSVFGFLPMWDSIEYFIELKIRTSAFAYPSYWSVQGQPFFLWKSAYSFPEIALYFIFFAPSSPFGFISAGISGAQ